jgi:hypothetical protein
MTNPKESDKPTVQTRQPKKKVTSGIFDNLRKLPAPHPVEEILGLAQPTTPSTGSTPSTDSSPSRPARGSTASPPSKIQSKSSVAPERDYTKVANSIVRQAVPAGIFGEQGGKSKELYDTLYMLTRGAVIPKRKIRIPKDQLMKRAGIGSEVTLRKNLGRLRVARLILESVVPGTHGGNEYEVFLPEEVGLETVPTPSTPSTPGTGSNTRQNQEAVEPVESRASSPGIESSESTLSDDSKTFLKDLRTIDDDAALGAMTEALKVATKQITGRDIVIAESDRWKELADVLIAELKIAAARTTISSVPAFLAEHLRRRLWKIDKKQAGAEGRELPDQELEIKSQFDTKGCPDCGGSGWWYPDGEAKGVAKCRHEKLTTES